MCFATEQNKLGNMDGLRSDINEEVVNIHHFSSTQAANAIEIGQRLAELGDKINNEQAGKQYELLAVAAFGIALTFAALRVLKIV